MKKQRAAAATAEGTITIAAAALSATGGLAPHVLAILGSAFMHAHLLSQERADTIKRGESWTPPSLRSRVTAVLFGWLIAILMLEGLLSQQEGATSHLINAFAGGAGTLSPHFIRLLGNKDAMENIITSGIKFVQRLFGVETKEKE